MQAKYKYLNKRYTNNSGQSGFVLKYLSDKEVHFKFDLTGWVGCFQLENIKNGEFKDKLSPSLYGIGFYGDGKYKATENGKITKSYTVWRGMLARCYDEKTQEKHPTYIGCSVAKEWHDFQCFADWYIKNYPKDGGVYHLDKDKLIKGNKVYSPYTCCFLTQQQNNEIAKAKNYKFISPSGEKVDVFNLNKFCRDNDLNAGHMWSVSKGNLKQHKGWIKHVV
jgi:hypothetical protein